MKREEILSIIEGLSHSQGFYDRLLKEIETMDEDEKEETLTMLENQKFKDAAELCDYVEQACGRI